MIARLLRPLRHLVGRRPQPVGGTDLAEARRTERIAVAVRWVAVGFALAQVTIHASPYPPGGRIWAYGLAGLLAAGNAALWAASRRIVTPGAARRLGLAALVLDTLVPAGFVWLHSSDPTMAVFVVLIIVIAEGALRFQLRGALGTWAATALLYAGGEAFGQWIYDTPLQVARITFRTGTLLVVALILGVMARTLARQRADLARSLEELEHVDAWRSRLISMLAHDVRSPLGTAISSLQSLHDRGMSLGRDDARELLVGTERQLRRTLSLAEDLLELARSAHGQRELAPAQVPVRAAVEHAIGMLPGADAVAVAIADDLHAGLDRARFEQIVTNLVSNALKHGRPPVRVSARQHDGLLTLRVSDRGQGVPPEEQPHLFAPFGRGRRADSVGLGLWIVGELAAAHGGRARYEPAGGPGATFVVELRELSPADHDPPPAPAPPTAADGHAPSARPLRAGDRSR